MTVTIVGAQLGDEGKGGIVDVFGESADVVARYQGGDNAGHTVVHGGETYKLSLVPSGAVRGKIGVLGNGCVVNPHTLFEELDGLHEQGLDPDVRVAERAHVIMPYHRILDNLEEDVRSDDDLKVGTTGRGIGPTYEDKVGRRGVRIGDLLDPAVLRDRLEYVIPQKRALIEDVYGIDLASVDLEFDGFSAEDALDVDAVYDRYVEYGERLRDEDMTVVAGEFLTSRIDDGEQVMLEGAQGTLLDIDHGNFPYVTSSNPTAGYAATGSGLGVTTIGDGEVVGVVKGYLSRVGTGPMPTELGPSDGGHGVDAGDEAAATGDDPSAEDLASYIREEGGEYGTVTGRPRRVGWLDLPMVRHAARASGFTGFAVNHVDVLAGLDEVKVGESYDLDGETIETIPSTTERWAQCEPNFQTFDGWPEVDWAAVAEEGYEALPENARTYLEYVAEEVDTDLYAVGLGPERDHTVVLDHPFE
ncbi:adenylosuccinate synthetase [Salinarchaeum sp. Harcht-Bsk1]|uniref:adenylosuccinate synthase n=1 Tax=Salinarchaeum sp. Harcht-Bsk1 TaxID=1333523 RepID=UPI00034247EF|nr:adenylosuccinate synthase [Salinarchaeum sp. Harcht-Bsk1]AGN00137.1 adenylosuccinate synthetase [Salinarchaeum sp. Harcht-Bsk1]